MLTRSFEDFCKKNYNKEKFGRFYEIPFRDVAKWEEIGHRRNHKLPIHKMDYDYEYDERITGVSHTPTLYLVDNKGNRQRILE